MALVERLMHENEPPDRWIAVHEFFAAMCELAGNALTKSQIETYYAMTAEDIVDFDTLTAMAPFSVAGRMMLVDRVHSIFILAEHRATQYSTPAEVRSKINAIAFPAPVETPFVFISGNATWTNMPNAVTELLGNAFRRYKINLSNADQARLIASITTQGAANAALTVQYSTDLSNWSSLIAAQMGIGTTGFKDTGWVAIPAGARGEVYVRVVGQSGDGQADPVITQLQLQVR